MSSCGAQMGAALIDVVRGCLAMIDDRWRKVRFAKAAAKGAAMA